MFNSFKLGNGLVLMQTVKNPGWYAIIKYEIQIKPCLYENIESFLHGAIIVMPLFIIIMFGDFYSKFILNWKDRPLLGIIIVITVYFLTERTST